MGVFFDELLNYLPDALKAIILLAAVVVIWHRGDSPKRTTEIFEHCFSGSPSLWVSFAVSCGK